MDALTPLITNGGLTALINAENDGVEGAVSFIAFGDANEQLYEPTATQTTLRHEIVRVPVAGGERAGPFEIIVEALLDEGPSFTINEVGFLLEDGTLLAVWASPSTSLAFKTADIPLAISYNLALAGIPPGSLTLNVSGPNFNLTQSQNWSVNAAAIATNSAALIGLMHRQIIVAIENSERINYVS